MTHPTLDVEHWDDSVPPEVIIADGYNVTVTVRDGHLCVSDGPPSAKRVRRIPRVSPMRTLVILGKHGYTTFEAKRWLRALDVRYVETEADQERREPRAVLGQVARPVPVARYLIGEKIQGQARVAEWFGEAATVKRLMAACEPLGDANATLDDIRCAEGDAAREYWRMWRARMVLPWHPRDLVNVPEQWTLFSGRGTLRRGKTRRNAGASDPVNAMLNYAYTVAANACTVACRAYGMEPSLGVIHEWRDDYDAFAWDLVEALRPSCDGRVYDYIRSVKFWDRRWCHETGKGVVELDPPLSHVIAGWSGDLVAEAMPVAKHVRGLLCASVK